MRQRLRQVMQHPGAASHTHVVSQFLSSGMQHFLIGLGILKSRDRARLEHVNFVGGDGPFHVLRNAEMRDSLLP